jgi:single-stranded DNA-binding protein
MKGIRCAFLAIAQDAEIKQTKRGHHCLALTVKLDAADEEDLRVWSFHDVTEIVDQIKPNATVYVEGVLKLRRWENAAGVACAALSVIADKVQVLFDIEAKSKPKRKSRDYAIENQQMGETKPQPSLFTGPAVTNRRIKHDLPFNDPLPF